MHKKNHVCNPNSPPLTPISSSSEAPTTQEQEEQQPTMIVPLSNAGVEPKAVMVEARHAFVTFAAMPGYGEAAVRSWVDRGKPISLDKHKVVPHS